MTRREQLQRKQVKLQKAMRETIRKPEYDALMHELCMINEQLRELRRKAGGK